MSVAPAWAAASAWRSRSSWALTFGAVSPAERPSWFTAEPRITARTGSPSASAAGNRFRTSTPHPSPRTYPLARASKVRHRPSGDRARPAASASLISGASMRFTPPASASVLSPERRLWQARWIATSDDEHAVSTVMLGPSRPNVYESRPAGKECPLPVTVWMSRGPPVIFS
jgi:hypothetical protein